MSKKRQLAQVNTEGWMMSYADMVTILLALFIVLSTLGKDQTGVALHKGVESYREAQQSFGLAGMFQASPRPVEFQAPMVRHAVGPDGDPATKADRSIDGEQEQLQHFLAEMDRQFRVEKLPQGVAQATVDLFDPLNRQPPYLTDKHKEVLGQFLPLVRSGQFRLTVIVWATTPSDTAWLRAAGQAQAIGDELAGLGRLSGAARSRLVALAQSWRYADYQRPVLSAIITKTQARD